MKYILLVLFLLFAGWVILEANLGYDNALVDFIRSIEHGDKIAHFLLFGSFTFLLNLALSLRTYKVGKLEFLIGSLIVLLIAMVEEFSQIIIPFRVFNWWDMLSNTLGIIVFSYLSIFFYHKKGQLAF